MQAAEAKGCLGSGLEGLAMSLEEFYESISGDLADVRGHLLTDERVTKFVKMFFDDPVNSQLCGAMENDDFEAAFRAAHTLKGLAVGMGFTALYDASYALTEALRPDDSGAPSDPGQVRPLFDKTEEEYNKVLEAFNTKF